MARPKKFTDTTLARFPTGTFERIEAALVDGQDRASFIREAVEEKVVRETLRHQHVDGGIKN